MYSREQQPQWFASEDTWGCVMSARLFNINIWWCKQQWKTDERRTMDHLNSTWRHGLCSWSGSSLLHLTTHPGEDTPPNKYTQQIGLNISLKKTEVDIEHPEPPTGLGEWRYTNGIGVYLLRQGLLAFASNFSPFATKTCSAVATLRPVFT